MLIPRPYQIEAEQSIWDYFDVNPIEGDPLIAMPTGTGKSLVIAMFIWRLMDLYPNTRILALTHVKELIKQNSKTLKTAWPSAPFGIFSAGLKQKDFYLPIIFGGVKSVANVIEKFEAFDILMIDEAHLLGPDDDSMYAQIIKVLRDKNPKLRIIKFTATPYRTGQGLISETKNICFNITGLQAFNKLISDGWLSPPISKRTTTRINLDNVGITKGDFNLTQLEQAVDTQDINYLACKEMIEYFHDRRSWLVFASGIKHAEHIAAMLRSFGIPTIAIHSKMGELRDAAIEDFKSGKLRCVVNNNVLTTGFDYPPIDAIGMLRPTCSTGLWVQMLGRGTRPSPETNKVNCLCLDFAGNTVRLGPINDPIIPKKREKGDAPGVPPIRICDNCGTYCHASERICSVCGFEFPINSKLFSTAGEEELLKSDLPILEWFKVDRIVYNKHVTVAGNNSLKVTYVCGKKTFKEFINLEHSAPTGKIAQSWWRKRMHSEQAPPSIDEALKWSMKLEVPKRIQIWINKMVNGKNWPEIVSSEFV